jgi:hypothetical protein
MKVEWQLPARMFVDQLSGEERATVLDHIYFLADYWEKQSGQLPSLKVLMTGSNYSGPRLYEYRVGTDLRAILTRPSRNTIEILDLVRRSQIEKLRSIIRGQA